MKRLDEGANVAFRVSLGLCTSPERLLWWMVQYVEFNRVFAGGVAALAGEIARCDQLFGGHETEIAANVFFAAIDEFRAPDGSVATHRALALKCLHAVAAHLQLDLADVRVSECTTRAIAAVRAGYYVRDADVLTGIGFHIGSESLADGEFNLLDTFLREQYPELVGHLEAAHAYTWVKIHGTVEAEHHQAAQQAAALATANYSGTDAAEHIENGTLAFANVQDNFMRELLTELQFV